MLANAYPLTVLQPLLKQTADALQMEVKPVVRTTVKAYDGTTVLMSDTIANQQSYPHTAIKSRMWLSVSKTGGVVLCDNRSV